MAIAAARGDCEIAIHQQCFASAGHFAGPDIQRLAALRETMADPSIDAVWFARGGYGSNRIAEAAARDLPPAARAKLFLGYSDAGFLLAAFDRAGLHCAHGPMPQDVLRDGGEAAVHRALDWMVRRDPAALEPDFTAADLLLEDVAEHDYRIDRALFHLTGQPAVRRVRQIRLGRMSDIPDNDPPFQSGPGEIVRDWCARSGIAFAGEADIGHDAANRVVPFTPWRD
jgi:muramoyltetrapeptide carboxypeptidase